MDKEHIRASLKRRRLAFSPDELAAKSQKIVQRVLSDTDWRLIKTIHCYEPIESMNEVDVSPLVELLRARYPQIAVYSSVRQQGGWNSINTRSGEAAEGQLFDAIIVPMLGFDPRLLHRIGYGGGYYDRLLAAQPQARKIGVCFEAGRLEHLPTEPHDARLDVTVTEDCIYK